jgi:hypothetical protein
MSWQVAARAIPVAARKKVVSKCPDIDARSPGTLKDTVLRVEP